MTIDSAVLTPDLITRIRDTLHVEGVAHSELVPGLPRLNLNAYQRGRVFVKVNRPGEKHGRAQREVEGATWASAHNLLSSVPWVPRVLEVADEYGERRDLTVWHWVESCTAPALFDQARMMSDLLVAVASIPPPPMAARFDLQFFLDRIHARLDERVDATSAGLIDAAEDAAAIITGRLTPERYRWLHGDLHAENLLWQVSGRPLVLDWESHCVGPVEWDVAQLLRSLYRDFPVHVVTERNRSISAAALRLNQKLDLDWDLVKAIVKFRAASSASHLHIHGHAPQGKAIDVEMSTNVPFRDILPT